MTVAKFLLDLASTEDGALILYKHNFITNACVNGVFLDNFN